MAAGITLDYFGTKKMQALKLIGIISILKQEELDWIDQNGMKHVQKDLNRKSPL